MSTERPKWGVFIGKSDRVHFSIGNQTFSLHNAADGDEDEKEHLEHQRAMLVHALRRLSRTDPSPVAQLANNWLAKGGKHGQEGAEAAHESGERGGSHAARDRPGPT